MPHLTEHLPEPVLEAVAEGTLPLSEQVAAAAHIEQCARCAAEVDAFRSLFEALGALPRFAPLPGFDDAVMARVRLASAPHPALAWLRRWMPSSPRGWGILVAASVLPALPVLALLVWLVSLPAGTPLVVVAWATIWLREVAWTALARGGALVLEAGVLEHGERLRTLASTVPTDLLGGMLLVLAVGIPLSAWSLVHLFRTPTGDVAHA